MLSIPQKFYGGNGAVFMFAEAEAVVPPLSEYQSDFGYGGGSGRSQRFSDIYSGQQFHEEPNSEANFNNTWGSEQDHPIEGYESYTALLRGDDPNVLGLDQMSQLDLTNHGYQQALTPHQQNYDMPDFSYQEESYRSRGEFSGMGGDQSHVNLVRSERSTRSSLPYDVVESDLEEDMEPDYDPDFLEESDDVVDSEATDSGEEEEDDVVSLGGNRNPAVVGGSGKQGPSVSWFGTEGIKYGGDTDEPADNLPIFDPSKTELKEGDLFKDKNILLSALKMEHLNNGKDYKTETSDKKKLVVVCSDPTCQWKLRGHRSSHWDNLWKISRLKGPHTCLFRTPIQNHIKISARMIADRILSLVHTTPQISVDTIIEGIAYDLHYRVTYKKAWYAKQKALADIYGKWDTSYNGLPACFAAVIHTNPGSVMLIETDDTVSYDGINIFRRMFWAFKPMIEGWQHARPVLTIDGTFLKGQYRGKILVAMGFDANNHQYPVAFAQCSEETLENWSWFLRLLRVHVCRDRSEVCIISDRAQSIITSMNDSRNGFCWPLGVHRFCLLHYRANFTRAYPGAALKVAMYRAGVTTQVRKFQHEMKIIREINPEAELWLLKVPLEQWTMSHDGGYRYGQASTNIVESFNNTIIQARFLPVRAMVEYTFYKSVKIMEVGRSKTANDLAIGHTYCARLREKEAENLIKSGGHKVTIFNRMTGECAVRTGPRKDRRRRPKGNNVQTVVLSDKICSCGKWQQLKYPCSHALAVCAVLSVDQTHLISPYYTLFSLNGMWQTDFHPLMHKDMWTQEIIPRRLTFNAPIWPNPIQKRVKKKDGGTGTKRIRTEMDSNRRGVTCGRCKVPGHTRRSLQCPRRHEPE